VGRVTVDEFELRERIFERLRIRCEETGGFLTRNELSAFDLKDGRQRRLIDTSKGIWNPRDLIATLSIVSSPDGPYDDQELSGGVVRYDYRAGSNAGDNTKLRRAGELGIPLIWLRKFRTGAYIPIFPVYVIEDDQERHQFLIAMDDASRVLDSRDNASELERRYVERLTRQRLHQRMFRGMVIDAYEVRCAVCRLRHGDLLDAAHIVADREETGLAIVTNGISLCKIHHAAYDRNLLGISGDYMVHINARLLAETDGPMLKHGLQEMHGGTLTLPSRRVSRPDPERLEARFSTFLIS
jgi:putative restriction endonuclease